MALLTIPRSDQVIPRRSPSSELSSLSQSVKLKPRRRKITIYLRTNVVKTQTFSQKNIEEKKHVSETNRRIQRLNEKVTTIVTQIKASSLWSFFSNILSFAYNNRIDLPEYALPFLIYFEYMAV